MGRGVRKTNLLENYVESGSDKYGCDYGNDPFGMISYEVWQLVE
jgi:hypothetical protein